MLQKEMKDWTFNIYLLIGEPSLWGFSWGQQPPIFAHHWTTNDLKVTRHKSITTYFFSLWNIFFGKIVSISNNDRFDNDKIFLCNIWHFSVITKITFLFFPIYLKDTRKNFVVNIWTISDSYCEVQSAI